MLDEAYACKASMVALVASLVFSQLDELCPGSVVVWFASEPC